MSYLLLNETADPGTPSSGKGVLFESTDKKVKFKKADGYMITLSNDGLQDVNIVTNGGMQIQQKVPTASTAIAGVTTTTRAGVVADRWAVTTSVASNLNWQQVDTGTTKETNLASQFYGSIISATAGKKVMISQWIIQREMASLRGMSCRLSVKTSQKVGSIGQKYRLGLLYLTAAGTADTCPTFLTGAWSASTGVDPAWAATLLPITPDAIVPENGTIAGNYLDILTTVAWLKSSTTFTIPLTAKNLMVVLFADATGGTTDNISVSEFILTMGQEIVDYVCPPVSDELPKCQRFFCKTFAYGTVPVTNAGINTGECKAVAGKAGAVANACIFAWRFPMTMQATPTCTLYNPAAANALGRDITGTADLGATAITAQLADSVMAISTGVTATAVGDQCGIHISASCEPVT